MPLPGKSNSLVANLRSTAGWFLFANVLKLGVNVWATRQLDASDYAMLATVLAIQGFVIGLTSFNMSSELVRAEKLDPDDIAVSWTCEAFRNILVWVAIILLAPLAAEWLQRPDATYPLRVSASALLIALLVSPRLVELRRAGKFRTLGMFDGVVAAGNAIITIVLVYFLNNYWALVFAGISTPLLQAAASYILAPWRPRFRFSWVKAAPMAKLGSVLLLLTWVATMREHGMVFVLSKYLPSTDLGFYNRALAFSYSLVIVVTALFWRVAYPTYSRHRSEGRDVHADAASMQRWILIAAIPVVAAALIGRNLWIPAILGEKWIPMTALWSWLVVAGALLLVNAPFEAAFHATRMERIGLLINGFSAALQLLIAWILLPSLGLPAAGVGMVVAITFSVVAFRIASRRYGKVQSIG